jgi:hypothetical protein
MDEDLINVAQQYALKRNVKLGKPLGFGVHGNVFAAEDKTKPLFLAVKFHRDRRPFELEYRVYERLHDNRITRILGFNVPQLLHFDEDFRAIEMTVVSPPFVLDFADARLDEPASGFSEEVLAQWEEERAEVFGERWTEVKSVLTELELLGIYLRDINPRNISFVEGAQ